MSDLMKDIANLSPARRELLLQRLNAKKKKLSPQAPKIRPQSQSSNSFPLSFAQQRLWFLEQLEPGNPFYTQPTAMRINGALNLAVLEQSFNEIRRRHQTLRTTFTLMEENPVQVIQPAGDLKIPLVDLQELPEAILENEVRRLATSEAQRPFNLAEGPLLRGTLLQLRQTDYVLLFTMHHIISDGWSKGVFIRELVALYEAFSVGKPSPLPDLAIQYVDFAVWQRQWLQGAVLETQLTYWRQQLQDSPVVLQLPIAHPRPAVQTFRGAFQSLQLSRDVTKALKDLSKAENATLFMTLLTAFKTLLYRYTGQTDILVGSPIANRNRREIEGLIGFFVNTLVMRTDLGGSPSFRELLRRVRKVALEAYAHQDLPFEQLVNELQLKRDLSYTPLFQVLFEFGNAPVAALEFPGVTLSALETEGSAAKFDLSLSMRETKEGLVGHLEYNIDLFEADAIARMLGHFQTLLESIIANPDQSLEELRLLTKAEERQLLVEWNSTQAECPRQHCIHQLFEVQVNRSPDSIAVVFEEQQLTYHKLNAKANQLAHHLQTLGVGPEVLVGVCLERSLEMIIGLIAILKAGGAYVPIDPTYPQDRIAFILQDAQVNVLLTQGHLIENLPKHQTRVICLDTDWEIVAKESSKSVTTDCTADNLAYVIYTSGSTGQPKGVLVNHVNVTRLLTTTQSWANFNQQDVWTLFHSISFDFSVWEIWGALLSGGRLIVVPHWTSRSPQDFYQLLLTQQVTILNQIPSAFRQLVRAEELSRATSKLNLRLVIFGGEALQLEILRPWFARHGDQLPQLVNMYGITETTVHVTYRPLTVADLETASSSVIGRPIPDLQIYLLDQHLRPVPIGIPGEMYIGGAGVARGYLNRPELTIQRFLPNPFNHEPNSYLYKSGDLAHYLPDGDIEYLGRIDHQVKIRGFRIELGEIENSLSQHPDISQAIVIAHTSAGDSQKLVAYTVAAHPETALSFTELRSFLQEKLPEYMIPAVFIKLDALPLNPNGKVDRRALPAPDTARPELDKPFEPPRNATEAQLVEIWANVLQLEQVGIHDNFFELGGDSILSIQVVAKANQAGLHLAPRQLFQHQTIARLAVEVGATKQVQAEQGPVTGLLKLTPIQRRFFEQEQEQPHHWNQAVLLQVKQRINLVALEKVLQHLQKHHDILRSRFIERETGFQAEIASPDNQVPLTYLDLSVLPKEKQVAEIEARAAQLQTILNLAEGPLFQVAVFDLGVNQPSRLLWIIHHLVVDGVSWRILIEDFQVAYQQISQEKPLQFPLKTTSFQQWSSYLQEYAQSSALHSEIDYWLAGHQSVKAIPKDFSGADNLEGTTSIVSVSLTVGETQVLLQHVPSVYKTQINDVLLTALVQAFAQWTGETSLLIDLEGHGREDLYESVDLSRTVGWFTTIFPVCLSLEDASASPAVALKSVKEQLRKIPNRGIGYGVLRYLSGDIEIHERFSRLPKAEVAFNYLGQFDQTLSASSLFELAQESSGPSCSLWNKRTHLLTINGGISEGRLQMNWTYNQMRHCQSTIELLAQRFIEAMRSLIAHCQSPDAGGFTPSDFADFKQSQWDQSDLDAIAAALGDS